MEITVCTKTVGKQREISEVDAGRELVKKAKEQDLALTGPDGLLKQLTKTVIETALDGELTEHLGYERHDAAAKVTANSRNGTRLIRRSSGWRTRGCRQRCSRSASANPCVRRGSGKSGPRSGRSIAGGFSRLDQL
ncbi:hypothetical protein GCM10023063_40170 [Arthrobacter methylotrophus]